MTIKQRLDLRDQMHLDIATTAAVAAGLATTKSEAQENMGSIIERHASELKASWLHARGGGIKGWIYFLRTFGFEERLVVRRVHPEAETALPSAVDPRLEDGSSEDAPILPPRFHARCS